MSSFWDKILDKRPDGLAWVEKLALFILSLLL